MADPNTTNVGGLGGFVGQILDLINGMNGQGTNRGNTAAGLADPFASQRPQYQTVRVNASRVPSGDQSGW